MRLETVGRDGALFAFSAARLPYPIEALGELEVVARALADRHEVQIETAAQACLGVAAALAQRQVDVEGLSGPVPTSLYLLTAVDPGERKSTTDKSAMRGIRAVEQEEREKEFEKAHAIYRRDKAEWDKCPEGDAPLRPAAAFLTMSDASVDGLFRAFLIGPPALLLANDDAGELLGGISFQPRNRLRTFSRFSKLWEGQLIDRVRGDRDYERVSGRRLSAHLLGQVDVIRQLLRDPLATRQGLLARCLIVEPESNVGTRTRMAWPEKTPAILDGFATITATLMREPPATDIEWNIDTPCAIVARRLPLTQDGHAMLANYYRQVEEAQASGGDLAVIAPTASRSAEQAVRLAAVLAFFEDCELAVVPDDAVERGIALAHFYLMEARRLRVDAVLDRQRDQAGDLLTWLHNSWNETFIDVTAITQFGRRPRLKAAEARSIVAELRRHGYLEGPQEARVRGRESRDAYRIRR